MTYDWNKMEEITVPVGINGWVYAGSVTINGVTVDFPIGIPTSVPEPVAELLKKFIALEEDKNKVPAQGGGNFIVNATEVTAQSPGEGLTFACTAKLDKTFKETTTAFRTGQQVMLVAENLMGEGEKWHIPAVMCTDDSLTLFQRVPGLDIVGNFNQDGTMNVSGFAT